MANILSLLLIQGNVQASCRLLPFSGTAHSRVCVCYEGFFLVVVAGGFFFSSFSCFLVFVSLFLS